MQGHTMILTNGEQYAGTYPSDRPWVYVCKLQELVVEAWLKDYG